MARHKSEWGVWAPLLPCDLKGMVPDQGDSANDFEIDHGSQPTNDIDGQLTDYGLWWAAIGFPEWVDCCSVVKRTIEQAAKHWNYPATPSTGEPGHFQLEPPSFTHRDSMEE